MDIEIITAAFITFSFFLALVVILFRIIRQESAILWIVRAFVSAGVVAAIFFVPQWGVTEVIFWASLYGLLTVLFVFGIFSIMEASLTLRFLVEISGARGGITPAELKRKYNRNFIVKRRIARLLYSGELKKTRGMYMLGRTSYFRLREYLLDIFRFAFG
jgi:hypothetical protein